MYEQMDPFPIFDGSYEDFFKDTLQFVLDSHAQICLLMKICASNQRDLCFKSRDL
jgi:hypothetical protein